MAQFNVTFDGERLDDSQSNTNWTGADSVETDFYYNGTSTIVNQIKTSRDTHYCTQAPSTLDTDFSSATGTRQVFLAKVIVTNWGGIDGNGVEVWMGSSSTALMGYYVFTGTTYPAEGGWQVVCIDPIADEDGTNGNPGYGGGTLRVTGTPDLTAIDTFLFACDASSIAKAPNFGTAAVDIIEHGTGLTGIRGDVTGLDGVFADFANADYGTASNRWGVVMLRDGILYVNGVLTIGESGTATEFTDENAVLVFPEHYVYTGFCGVDFDVQNASTEISLSNCVFSGRGAAYTAPVAHDTRPDYEVIGTSGAIVADGCTFNGYRLITLTSVAAFTGCAFIGGGESLVAGEADLTGSTFDGFTGAADDAYVDWDDSDPDGNLDDCTFIKLPIWAGANDHHAISFGTSSPTTMTLRGITFSGFTNTIGNNDAPLLLPDTGSDVTWTINAVDCSGITADGYKKARSGDTVNIVIDPRTVTMNVRKPDGTLVTDSTDFTLVRASDGTVLHFEEDQTDGISSYQYTYSSDVACYLNIVTSGPYVPKTIDPVTLIDADQTVNVYLEDDRVFSNP